MFDLTPAQEMLGAIALAAFGLLCILIAGVREQLRKKPEPGTVTHTREIEPQIVQCEEYSTEEVLAFHCPRCGQHTEREFDRFRGLRGWTLRVDCHRCRMKLVTDGTTFPGHAGMYFRINKSEATRQ